MFKQMSSEEHFTFKTQPEIYTYALVFSRKEITGLVDAPVILVTTQSRLPWLPWRPKALGSSSQCSALETVLPAAVGIKTLP